MISEDYRHPKGQEPNRDSLNTSTPSLSDQPIRLPDKNLRILFISDPNSIHTRRWVSWFTQRGHIVCLLADVPPKETWSEVQVIDLSKIFYAPVIRFPIWTIWLRRFMQQWKPDILHAHRVNSAGWLGAASGFHPLVVTPWGSDVMLGPQRSKLLYLLARFTLREADMITVISHVISEKVLELGARKETLARINNGVDLNIFSPRSVFTHARQQLNEKLLIPENARLVFSPRAIHPIYNQDIVVQAIPRVRERFPEVCFLFIAYNPNLEYKQGLERSINQLGVNSTIRWLPSTSNPAEMAERYRLSDVVISVPSSDGAPLTVMEAMACEKPVICSDLPAIREFITDSENGWIVPVRQASPLAEVIIHALEQPEQAAEIGRKAHQFIVNRADLNVEMRHMETIYYQLAG